MKLWHKQLEGRFSTFPAEQQLLMVCNELNRAHHQLDDTREYRNCLKRSLELMDFLISDRKWQPKLKEILRAREVIAQYYLLPPRDTKSLQRQLIQLNRDAWRMVKDD